MLSTDSLQRSSLANGASNGASVLASILSGENYWPSEPRSLHEAGLTETYLQSLVSKHLLAAGTLSGRMIADRVALPFAVIEKVFSELRGRKLITYTGAAPLNDYFYILTESGQQFARNARSQCAYVGAAPVPLMDYVISVEAQAIADESVRHDRLADAFADISVEKDLFNLLGPAVNSGAGMFLYGSPGNGKSTIAERITNCFGQSIWIPQAIVEDGEIIKLYDLAYHTPVKDENHQVVRPQGADSRWVRIRRPTVIVGGELTMENLELRHDPRANVSEAPLQMKSNGGCLLIDDFGRQRLEPAELLNRWIVPLEDRHDFLTLATGKKIQVPFEQLILFSTNLEPADLVDEAFLRRIPYKIEIGDPSEDEFRKLFAITAEKFDCDIESTAIDYLLEEYYRKQNRPFRRCHPRDFLAQLTSYCSYHDMPVELTCETVDCITESYFTAVPMKQLQPGM